MAYALPKLVSFLFDSVCPTLILRLWLLTVWRLNVHVVHRPYASRLASQLNPLAPHMPVGLGAARQIGCIGALVQCAHGCMDMVPRTQQAHRHCICNLICTRFLTSGTRKTTCIVDVPRQCKCDRLYPRSARRIISLCKWS